MGGENQEATGTGTKNGLSGENKPLDRSFRPQEKKKGTPTIKKAEKEREEKKKKSTEKHEREGQKKPLRNIMGSGPVCLGVFGRKKRKKKKKKHG